MLPGQSARGQQLHGFGRVDLAHAAFVADLREEVRDQQRDVFAPAVERRHLDVHDVQAVVEVFAELAAHHELLQVAVRGRDHAHVDRDGVGGADGADLVLLQHAQQLHLQAHRHVADLVEQQRAAVGRLEQAARDRAPRR